MKLHTEQYKIIKDYFPKQRKAVKFSNAEVLNTVLYLIENGCKWRSLPKEFGDWHVIYVQVNRWAKGCAAGSVSAFAADGNYLGQSERGESGFHLHQGAFGWDERFEKSGTQFIGKTRGGWNTKLHMVAAFDRDGVIFALFAGYCGNAPEGRFLLRKLGPR